MPHRRAVIEWIRRLATCCLLLPIVVVNLRLYTPSSGPADHGRLDGHLRFLRSALDDGLGERMQTQFPEGYYFSHVLHGLTWVQVGLSPDTPDEVVEEALDEARAALAALDTPAGRAPFSSELTPPFGMFYVGWANYLRAGIVALQIDGLGETPDADELSTLRAECDAIVDAVAGPTGPFVASYPGQVWPVDTYPAIVSVQGCAEFVDDTYRGDVERWLDRVDDERDPVHGLVGHRTEPFREHPRATSQTIILRLLAELDPDRAAADYDRFRRDFVTSVFGLPAVREHPPGIDQGGDVDSGPLIAGASASASVVAVGTAQANGDDALARALRQEGEAFGFPVTLPGGRRYAAGLLPLGDLFVVWASSTHRWFQPEPADVDFGGPGWSWRMPTHLLSFVIGLGAWAVLWPGARRRAATVRTAISDRARAGPPDDASSP